MSAEPVAFVLSQLQSVQDSTTIPIELFDRDTSQLFDSGIRERQAELQEAIVIGATLADRAPEPIGTEYDHRLETVVGVRIEGLSHVEHGYVDPSGEDGVVWTDFVDDVRRAILAGRAFPDAGRSSVSFTDLRIQNEAAQSADWQDYYRYDFDVAFRGFETLPDV